MPTALEFRLRNLRTEHFPANLDSLCIHREVFYNYCVVLSFQESSVGILLINFSDLPPRGDSKLVVNRLVGMCPQYFGTGTVRAREIMN
jgi:hypothetical protein